MLNNKIVVSIAVFTYNHSKYIAQALDSILMQNFDLIYEIIIGDDCSTDNTQEILKKYKEKYPNLIKLILRDENVGPTKNFYDVLIHCKGEYIAQLEGDDFWTDCEKLKRQVEILKNNSDFIAVSHSCNTLVGSKLLNNANPYYYKEDKVYQFEDFLSIQFPGHTCTLVYRNIFLNYNMDFSIIYKADRNTADRTINLLLVLLGKIFCMHETMSTYRLVLDKKAANINSLYHKKNVNLIQWNYLLNINNYCIKNFGKPCISDKEIDYYIISSLKYYIKAPNSDNWRILKEIFSQTNDNVIYYLILICKKFKQQFEKL